MYRLFTSLGKTVLDELNNYFQKLNYQRIVVWPLYKFAAFNYIFHNTTFEITITYTRLDTEVKFIIYYAYCTSSPTSSFVNITSSPIIKLEIPKLRTFLKLGNIELTPEEVKLVKNSLTKFINNTLREIQSKEITYPIPKIVHLEECDLIYTIYNILRIRRELPIQHIKTIPGVKFSTYVHHLYRIVRRKIEKDFIKEITKSELTIEDILREPFLTIDYSLRTKLYGLASVKKIRGLEDFLTVVLPLPKFLP